jgi:hypothetical protein
LRYGWSKIAIRRFDRIALSDGHFLKQVVFHHSVLEEVSNEIFPFLRSMRALSIENVKKFKALRRRLMDGHVTKMLSYQAV